jgi:hypothetical protein
MEGIASKLLCKRGGGALVALLAIGILTIGLAACGSGSSSTTDEGSAVVKKEAGLFNKDVQLTVVNHSSKTILVTLCSKLITGVCSDTKIDAGGSQYAHGRSLVSGKIILYAKQPVTYEDGSTNNAAISNEVDFYAENPEVGEPWLSVLSHDADPIPLSSDPGDIPRWRLSEGQTEGTDIGQNGFSMSRSEDTDNFKVMTLTVDR